MRGRAPEHSRVDSEGISAMINATIKSRVTSRAEDTRRKIYEAAMALFREKGFEETTMRDIASKAGVALDGSLLLLIQGCDRPGFLPRDAGGEHTGGGRRTCG